MVLIKGQGKGCVAVNVFDFADKYLRPYRIKGDELVPMYCCYCKGGKNKDKYTFAINTKTLTFNCKRGKCGVYGSFNKLLMDFGESEKTMPTRRKKQFKKSTATINKLSDNVETYIAKRHISKETCLMFGIGDDGNGNIMFPYYRNKDIVAIKYRPARKMKPGENKMWREEGTDTTVPFGMNVVDFSIDELVITEGECFPGDVEVLTPYGWIPFDRYGGQPVLQIDENLKASFTIPNAYVKKPYNGNMIRVTRGGNYVTMTTPEHNLVYFSNNRNGLVKRKANEMPKSINGFIPTTAIFNGKGIPLNNKQLALCIAVSADGTIGRRFGNGYKGIMPKEMRYVRFGFSKQRKVDRLIGILESLKIEYSNNKLANGTASICFSYPEWGTERLFPQEWVNSATLEQRKFILNEIVFWDGNRVKGKTQTEYTTKHYHNAVFIQTIAHTCGIMSTIAKRRNSIGSWYKVSILHEKNSVSWQNIAPKSVSYDDYVYCVTVPSGMILVRQEEHITVSGNCDALALYESGIRNVISVPNGSEDVEWIDCNWDFLEKFRKITICGDNDVAGRNMVSELIPKLGEWRCNIVEIPEGRKDANEVLVKHGKEFLKKIVKDAKDVTVKGLLRLAEVKAIDLASAPKVKSGIPGIDKMLGGFVFGQVTVWTGENSSGKSTLMGQILLEAINEGHAVCAYSGELPAPLFKYWIDLQAAGEKHISHKYDYVYDGDRPYISTEITRQINEWYWDKFFLYDNSCLQDIDSIMKFFEYSARRHNCKVALIDNLMMVVTGAKDDYYLKQTELLKKLSQFAKKFNVHIHIIAHPRKAHGRIAKMDIYGSSNIPNLADNIASVHRITPENKTEKEMIPYCDCDTLVDIFKCRLTGKQDVTIGLRFNENCKRFYQNSDKEPLTKDYGWVRDANDNFEQNCLLSIEDDDELPW